MYLAKLWLLVLGMVQEAKTIVLLDMVKNSQVHLDKEIFVPLNGFTFCLQFYLESLDEHWVLFKAQCLKITKMSHFEIGHFPPFYVLITNEMSGNTFLPSSPKMAYLTFSILAFSTNFCPLKLTCLVTLFDWKLQAFKTLAKLIIFGILNELLSPQNVNVAYFATNVE